MYKKIAKNYFKLFSGQNLDAIAEIFSDDIVLRDWELNVSGKFDVLSANQNIFNSVKSINVIPLKIIADDRIVVAELEIIIDDKEHINVVDILEFDHNDKIKSIRAYKG